MIVFQESDRVVTKKEGLDFAREYGCLFIECSAKTRINVQNCFEELVLKVCCPFPNISLVYHQHTVFISCAYYISLPYFERRRNNNRFRQYIVMDDTLWIFIHASEFFLGKRKNNIIDDNSDISFCCRFWIRLASWLKDPRGLKRTFLRTSLLRLMHPLVLVADSE